MKVMLLAALLFVAATGGAVAQAETAPAEASIPFVNQGSIRDWRADGRDGIFVQDAQGRWYRGAFMSPCNDLPYSETIGFETRGPDQFDRFATILVRHQRCHLSSFVKSMGPPKRDKNNKQKIEQSKPADARPGTGY